MKKLLKVLCILMLVAIIITFIVIKLNAQNSQKDVSSNTTDKYSESLYYSNTFLANSSNDFRYEDDMTFYNSVYYKVINDYETYTKYKENYPEIITLSEEDLKSNFLVLIIKENESTKNLSFSKIDTNSSTLYIGLDYKVQTGDSISNNGISIKINNSLLRDNIEVFKTIENTDFMENYENIKSIPYNYTSEKALADNCFIVSTTAKAQNTSLFKDFLDKIESNEDAEIRIFSIDEEKNSIILYDLKYSSLDKKYYVCVDETRVHSENLSNSSYNYYEFDTLEEVEENGSITFNSNLKVYQLKNSEFPKKTIGFSFLTY